MLSTLTEVAHEQARQRKLWGVQNHPSFLRWKHGYLPPVDVIREMNDGAVYDGCLAWELILLEEVAEALEERTDLARLREELIQVAAVAMSWVESIDRNGF